MSTYALLVGIERYDQPGWNVEGPAANALEVARRLLGSGVPAANITLFLTPVSNRLDAEIQALADQGASIHRTADFERIDTFWRTQLAAGRDMNSQLLVYWSGHGFTSQARERVFFCGDYTSTQLTNRVFNCMTFIDNLRGDDFACFAEQLIVADVCGVYSNAPYQDTRGPQHALGRPQPAYFATPEGTYARGATGQGVFTMILVDVLGALGGWPINLEAFDTQLTAACRQHGQTPFRFQVESPWQQQIDTIAGQVAQHSSNPLLHAALQVLEPLDIRPEELRRHYRATLESLGLRNVPLAPDLAGMLHVLSGQRDAYGLLEFVARLARPAAVEQAEHLKADRAAKLDAWLESRNRPNTVRDIKRKLDVEEQQKILLIAVEMNEQRDDIAGYQPYLVNGDYVLSSRRFEAVETRGWDAFAVSLQTLWREFTVGGELLDISVHFLVEPPLIDRPFHLIPSAPGRSPIGEQVLVIIRDQRRVLAPGSVLGVKWTRYAEELRTRASLSEVKWLRVDPQKPTELRDRRELWYAGFALPPATRPGGCFNEKRLVDGLLKVGAPFVYLPHEAPADADWQTVERELAALLDNLATLDAVPDKFLDSRFAASPFAEKGSMLWDDPQWNPFKTSDGIPRL